MTQRSVWLRCRPHSSSSCQGFALKTVSMVVTRKISNIQGLTSVEGWKALRDDATARGTHISLAFPRELPRTKARVPAGRLRSPSSAPLLPQQGPAALVYAERQIPAGDPGPSQADILPSGAKPDMQVHFRGLRLARALGARPPGTVALTRPGIVLPVLRSFPAAQRMNASRCDRNCSLKMWC